MDNNPFRAPPLSSPPIVPRTSSSPVPSSFVDGDSLIVASGTVLPEICIKTNQPVSSADMKKLTTIWYPSWIIGFFFLAGPFGLLIAYLATQKKCVLTFGLQPRIRKRYRNRLLVKSLIVFVLFWMMLLSTTLDVTGLPIVLLVLLVIAVLVAFVGNSPISIKEYRDGAFWIKGCSQEFLMGLLE
ncbi:MAG: hypothetical protein JXM70_00950 [Pirellulales bacterium]|nr:hypothetical protein [Pirellulales bacterium]